jgi:penicillin V acylase-like amidase (Ntn superfamily)
MGRPGIGQLQNANGRFRWTADSGISSLENAYFALKALMEVTY